jgi:hypothetical protein
MRRLRVGYQWLGKQEFASVSRPLDASCHRAVLEPEQASCQTWPYAEPAQRLVAMFANSREPSTHR